LKNGEIKKKNNTAKPFLKWAGGKTQLLSQFEDFYPKELKEGKIKKYIEPFLGSGAVFFHIVQKYEIESAYLYDINEELITTYQIIKEEPHNLIDSLDRLSKKYQQLNENERKDFYYKVRTDFNKYRFQSNRSSKKRIKHSAELIFLNKTCFNGLYRLNRNGDFNVPFGNYKNPRIINEENILNVSQLLRSVEINNSSYEKCEKAVDENSFVYFDPPYRPISQTSSFTSYSKFEFGEDKQKELVIFFNKLSEEYHSKLLLSNSDPTNSDPNDDFFQKLYKDYSIHKVSANRMINSVAKNRGHINELLITNYW